MSATGVRDLVLAGLALGLAAAVWWAWQPSGPRVGAGPDPAAPQREPATLGTMARGARPAPPDPQAAAGRSLDTLLAWLANESSLRDTALDGDWGLDAGGALRPSIALRRRFDQLLTLTGEASADELARLVAEGTRQDASARGLNPADAAARAAEVLDLWQRYRALLDQRWRHEAVATNPATWPAALAERQAARREHLGPAWAAAFYAAEEQALLQALRALEQRPAGLAAARALPPDATPPLIDPATLDAAGRARLDDELRLQAVWAARLAAARDEQARLVRVPELSAPQREAALRDWIAARFDVAERPRVSALLALPPG